MGATFTIAPFQGATFRIDASKGRSGFAAPWLGLPGRSSRPSTGVKGDARLRFQLRGGRLRPRIGATFTIAPFQGATRCTDASRGRSGFVLRTTP